MAYILLRIISRMRKDPEIKTPLNAITAGYNNAVLPSLDEVVIENYLPLCVH
jgi:hypothetical protein